MKKESNEKRLSIRHWAEDDRPREKLLAKGAATLSDAELLAILIGSGNKDVSAVELCRRILHDNHDNMNELARLSVIELEKYKGIGQAKAVTICAALEIGKRRKTKEMIERKKVTNSRDLFELLEPVLVDLRHEEFWVVFMNNAYKIREIRRLTQGGMTQTVVDVSMLLRLALEHSVQAIAVAHNHPSGEISPSREDDMITQKIKNGCDAIGISLVDHLIIATGNYYSYADEGKI